MSLSSCIAPHVHIIHNTNPAPTVWAFNDNSIVVYPRGTNGKTLRVAIIRRTLKSNTGCVISAIRNGGRWFFKVLRPFADKTTSMTKDKFMSELARMGISQYADDMLSGEFRPMD